MHRFYRRRRHSNYGEKKLTPWRILLICAAVTLLVTIIVGNLLNLWLDEDILHRLTEGDEETEVSAPDNTAPIRKVHAYAYTLGENTDRLWEAPEVSISINLPNGTVCYPSKVANRLGYTVQGSVELGDGMEKLAPVASYISGIFYPQALLEEDSSLRYAETLKECALMWEFIQAGGNEILICGLPLEGETVDTAALLAYLQSVQDAVGETANVGVALPLSFVSRSGSWKVIGKLLQTCDVCALDLREADAVQDASKLLAECGYYLTQYNMRLLLDETQSALLEAAAELDDLQTATPLPTSSDAEKDAERN